MITWCCVNYSDRGRLAAIRLQRPCKSQWKPTPHVYSEIRSDCSNRGRQEDGCERLLISLGSFRKEGFRGKSRFGRFTRRAAGGWRGYTPHLLRATTATLLLDAGVDIIKVKELLGHRQLTTQTYDKRRRNFKEWASHDMPICWVPLTGPFKWVILNKGTQCSEELATRHWSGTPCITSFSGTLRTFIGFCPITRMITIAARRGHARGWDRCREVS